MKGHFRSSRLRVALIQGGLAKRTLAPRFFAFCFASPFLSLSLSCRALVSFQITDLCRAIQALHRRLTEFRMTQPPLAGTAQSFVEHFRGRRLTTVISMALIALLLLHVTKKIDLNGWDIAIFLVAVLPYSTEAIATLLTSLGETLRRSDLKLLHIGSFQIEQLERRVSEQAEQIDEQRSLLDDLVLYSMSFYIYEKLKYLYLGTIQEFKDIYGEYKYVREEAFDHDLRYLRDHGYLELFQISQLNPGDNLVGILQVAPMGRRFVELNEFRDLKDERLRSALTIAAKRRT